LAHPRENLTIRELRRGGAIRALLPGEDGLASAITSSSSLAGLAAVMLGSLVRPRLRWLTGTRRAADLKILPAENGAAYFRVRRNGVISFSTPGARHITGSASEYAVMLRRRLRDLLLPDSPAELESWLRRAWQAEPPGSLVLSGRGPAGTTRWFELNTPGVLGDKETDTVVVEVRDATARAEMEQRQRLLATALDAAADAVFIMDRQGSIVYVNGAFQRMSGYTATELAGRPVSLLTAGRRKGAVVADLWDELGRGASWAGEIADQRPDGSSYTLEVTISPLNNGAEPHLLAICRDSTAREHPEREPEDHAYYDGRTGLASPRLMREHARQFLALARRNGTTAALLHIDLDDISAVTKHHDHITGDDVLRSLTGRLRQELRESDAMARVGQDEFLILLTEVPDEQAVARIVKRLEKTLTSPLQIHGHAIVMTAHAGVALYPPDAGSYDELLLAAESALRHAQQSGAAFEFFERGLGAAAREQLSLEDDLHWAWENDQFLLHYQPIVGTDGQVVGAEALTRSEIVGPEALARWPEHENGIVGPSQFIPLAERTGRILSLDRWAIATAVRQTAAWSGSGWTGWVAVNLSARSLHDPELPDYVAATLATHDLEAGRLVIEITESTTMRDPRLTALVLERLRASGALIAVDDFGVGHSSLAYLKLFPVDLLKLDACFVRELGTGGRDEQLVDVMISLAHRIGARVVAEGVEDERQLEWLRRAGCDYIQGYLVGRPVPPATAPEGRLPLRPSTV
jgi:diguanylate cyclase (GGDEF)-like protein/PAS domain S-box-containing protein